MIHYTQTGNGPNILLIHGWASSSVMWQSTIEILQDRFCVWAVDLPGFGNSPLPQDFNPYVEHDADILIEFCQQHHIQPYAIIGHSMGGMIALKMVIKQPDIAQQLVLVCPVITGRISRFPLKPILNTIPARYALELSKSFSWVMQNETLARWLTTPWQVNESIASQIVNDFMRADWLAITQGLESLVQEDLTPYLKQIQQPTLVMVGERDFTVPPAEGHIAAHYLPNALLDSFPECAHQLPDEDPTHYLSSLNTFLNTPVIW